MERYYNKRALVIRCGAGQGVKSRFEYLTTHHLHSLNILKMLKNTSSDRVHVWQQPKVRSRGIKSVAEESAEEAYRKYRDGKASLYFGAPTLFRDLIMKRLNYAMGQNFAGYYKAGSDPNVLE